ncbi:MAG: fibronectin type III domain-containing protein [candidate division Zixibacteria bacterium]|jgi:hypothetical protein|nr:fibronectin type III domain-containing protein [candidate division Zixibacteria bacterium]
MTDGGRRTRLTVVVLAACFTISIIAVSVSGQSETVSIAPADTAIAVRPPAPPTSVVAEDYKYDNAKHLVLSWVPSIDDQPGRTLVLGYRIFRSSGGGAFMPAGSALPGASSFRDERLSKDSSYVYYVAAVSATDTVASIKTQAISPKREYLHLDLVWLFVIAFCISSSVIYFIWKARAGKKLFVRKIAGLDAVDEAIGRATEMGRPILFIPGIQDMDDVQTIAGLTILGRVAKQIADYDTRIRMPVSRSLVMTAARETIKAAYQIAGRPDAYSDDMVNYVTDEQFGYVAAVDGIMVREKPATIFLLGAFFAESLILAETGNSIGAIQIAGTARPAQLPFFIAACDFTLIGEELFAASAYLSGEPKQLGSLKGQDVGKGLAMAAILLGVLSVTLGQAFDIGFFNWLADGLSTIFSAAVE